MKKQKLSSRLLSFAIMLSILAIPTLLCGFTVSFKAAFQTLAFFLSALIPLFIGSFTIYKYFWENQKLASFLMAFVIGLTFFCVSFVGMTMDERINSWQKIFSISIVAGVVMSILSFIISPIYASFIRSINSEH